MELRGHSIYAYQTADDEDAVVKMKPAKEEEVEDDTFQDDEETLAVNVSTSKPSKKDNYKYFQDDDGDEGSDAVVAVFASISTWFIRIGMVVAGILLLYFIFTGKIGSAVLYILGLIVAFFFGYFFMFLLDKFTSAN